MEPGFYTFYNQTKGRYLSYEERSLVLRPSPFPWNVQQSGQKGFFIYATGTERMLDIDNAWVIEGNRVKLWEQTGSIVQLWSVVQNENGTCTIVHSADPRYCLGFDGENAVLQLRRKNAPMQQWQLRNVSAVIPKEYRTVLSKSKTVELQLPLDMERIISMERLKLWADELEIAYRSFGELTGFLPFDSIVVEAYRPAPDSGYAGWVYPNSNRIHIDRDFLYGDLAKMKARRQDWNFCALHEMGHMFDFGRPWNFEGELMTDLKVAYVMEKNRAAAAPAQFPASTCFVGSDIAGAYAAMGRDFSEQYDIFACTKRFLDIKDQIGWAPFRQTFRFLSSNHGAESNDSKQRKFLLFTETLSRFSNRDISRYFSPAEWNSILRETNR